MAGASGKGVGPKTLELVCGRGGWAPQCFKARTIITTQRAQYPLTKEYTLNGTRVLNMI